MFLDSDVEVVIKSIDLGISVVNKLVVLIKLIIYGLNVWMERWSSDKFVFVFCSLGICIRVVNFIKKIKSSINV